MLEMETIRRVPFSMEAEQAVLGAIIRDSEQLTEVMGKLRAEDFYLENHRAIYSEMVEMFTNSRIIDPVTLINALTSVESYSEGDAAKYIKLLVEMAVVATGLSEHIQIIKDKSILRSVIEASRKVAEIAVSETESAGAVLDLAEQSFFEIAQNRYNVTFDHIKDVIIGHYEHLNLLQTDPESLAGTKTGFSDIDSMIVGMGGGDMIVVGGRPGMGKTSFCVNIAVNVAKRTKKEVAIFSLEMSSEQLVSRILSGEALIDSHTMKTGRLDAEQWKRLAEAASSLSETHILIDDSANITASTMKAKLRRLKNLGLVIIDYLQLMQSERKIDNRVQEVAAITRALKLLAKDLNVPIILCSQLARGTETRADKTPMMSDLRDSGTIEQDADMIMFLYRDSYYAKPDEKGDGKGRAPTPQAETGENNLAKVEIAKNRHGSTGSVEMAWFGQYFKYRTIDKNREQ